MSKSQRIEHLDRVLHEIASDACSLRAVCSEAIAADDLDAAAHLMVAARDLASKVGWIADSNTAGPKIVGGAEDWLLSNALQRSEAATCK